MTREKHTLAFDDTTTQLAKILSSSGIINTLVLVLPNFTNVVTGTISILDDDSYVLYTSAAKNRNTTSVLTGLAIPCDRNFKVRVDLDGAAGGTGGNVVTKIYLEERK